MKQVFLIELSDLGYSPTNKDAVEAFTLLFNLFADVVNGHITPAEWMDKLSEVEKYLKTVGKYHYTNNTGAASVLYASSSKTVPIMMEVLHAWIELEASGVHPIGITFPKYVHEKKTLKTRNTTPAEAGIQWIVDKIIPNVPVQEVHLDFQQPEEDNVNQF